MLTLRAGPDDDGRRLDRVLRKALPGYSLSLIHKLLRQGKVLVNGIASGLDTRVRSNMEIQVKLIVNDNDNMVNRDTVMLQPLPPILWRGSGIIVFNKPSGMLTHGRNSLETIVNAHLAGSLPPSLSFRPGPLHRLDKPTSGAIAFSETIDGARLFSRLLSERKLSKTYLAVVEGKISGEEIWHDKVKRDTVRKKTTVTDGTDPLRNGGASAFTTVKCLASGDRYSLIEANIITGRTHQIRAQAAAHGHPLAGDKKYGGHGLTGFFLHARKIEINGDVKDVPDNFNRCIIAPLPELFLSFINETFYGNPICR